MKNINSIFNEYKKSDCEQRLNLFLQHRMLRKEFLKIEMKESIVNREEVKSRPKILTDKRVINNISIIKIPSLL